MAQKQANDQGFQQVLWLSGPEHEITEIGTMNAFAVIQRENQKLLITPPISSGMILPGVVRQSVIEMVKDWGGELTVLESSLS